MRKSVIICVDDEKMVLNSIKAELKGSFGDNYVIETAENADEAIEILEELLINEHEIPLIISDYVMPNVKGDELLAKVHQRSPQTLKILLTGQATMEGVTNSINNANLYRYIAKPWEPSDLELTVNEAIKSFFKDKLLEEQNIQLKILNTELERKVEERTAEIQQKNIILEEQKNELYHAHQNLTGSINYARRIQQAMLISHELFFDLFPDAFILYKPKAIVSGDFYWAASVPNHKSCDGKNENLTIVAVADCTGHGVPGAFMSLLGMSFLSEIVQNNLNQACELSPGLILKQLRDKVKLALRQTGKENETKDGMDISLCIINGDRTLLHYAGAYNPLFIVRNNTTQAELIEVAADRMPIGIYIKEKEFFTDHKVELVLGDCLYLFSDGYVDQFGGPDHHEKFKKHRLKELLLSIQNYSMTEQKAILEKNLQEWQGLNEQLDDISFVGIHVR